MTGLLVHEWISRAGGSEKVLDAMAESFPSAHIACLWNDDPARFSNRIVTESWMAKTPLRRSKILALPFMIPTRRAQRADDYEWVLTSSHLFADHADFGTHHGSARKYSYIHTPGSVRMDP